MQNNYFFRIFKLKDKFWHLINDYETSCKKDITRQVSKCITEKFNGFSIVCIEYDWRLRKTFLPIDIIYNPVKYQTEKIICFSSDQMQWAYRSAFSNSTKIRHGNIIGMLLLL